MHSLLKKMPRTLAEYLQSLMAAEGFDKDEGSRNLFLKTWLKKRALFDKIMEHNGFVLVDKVEPDFREGILIITYSGSLLTISPLGRDGTRDLRYESIKLRRENAPNIEEQGLLIDFPLLRNQPVVSNGSRIVKTSPVFAMAIEQEAGGMMGAGKKRLRMIGERISRGLLIINKALFEKNSTASELENREDLFRRWVVLSWFRFGGWEEDVFLARAQLLWLELFSEAYNHLSARIPRPGDRDHAFMSLCNGQFPHYCDVYKWLESQRRNFDIGLMKALEEIPDREDYKEFLRKEL